MPRKKVKKEEERWYHRSRHVVIYLPIQLYEQIRAHAEKKNISFSKAVREILEFFLQTKGENKQ